MEGIEPEIIRTPDLALPPTPDHYVPSTKLFLRSRFRCCVCYRRSTTEHPGGTSGLHLQRRLKSELGKECPTDYCRHKRCEDCREELEERRFTCPGCGEEESWESGVGGAKGSDVRPNPFLRSCVSCGSEHPS